MAYSKILIRATNWLGDVIMSLPAVRLVRARYPAAQLVVVTRPWVAGIYTRESAVDRVIPYSAAGGWRDLGGKVRFAGKLRKEGFDCAILLQNAFEAAMLAWLARIPVRIGYDRDARGWLLTAPVPVPKKDETPRHERYYYLELLRRAGLLEKIPIESPIRLEGVERARAAGMSRFAQLSLPQPVVGVAPGAAYGGAKRWLPERFAQAASQIVAARGGSVALFGSAAEQAPCKVIEAILQADGIPVLTLAGKTSLPEFVDLAAACRVFLSNDSGAMHVASAVDVPTVAIFGATDHSTTGPCGSLCRVVREPVDCSPCLLRECPIDHRCMTRVTAEQVAQAALDISPS